MPYANSPRQYSINNGIKLCWSKMPAIARSFRSQSLVVNIIYKVWERQKEGQEFIDEKNTQSPGNPVLGLAGGKLAFPEALRNTK